MYLSFILEIFQSFIDFVIYKTYRADENRIAINAIFG
jgi:hypothetical protein